MNFKTIKNFLKNIIESLVEHYLVVFFFLILIAFLIANYFFYNYAFVPVQKDIPIKNGSVKFNKELNDEILKRWQIQDERYSQIDSKKNYDPFYPELREIKNNKNGNRLTEEKKQELLLIPNIQELLKANNLYEFYIYQGESSLLIRDRAEIYEDLGLGAKEEYEGGYNQNILLLDELKKELTN